MGIMTTLPVGRAFTRADLDSMPDDGRRYELIDGSLVVTPAPSIAHQTVVVNLVVALARECPRELKVLVAPSDVVLAADSVVQPDVLVARRRDLTQKDLVGAPLLAIEVLSASTHRIDTTLKKSRYGAAGCPSYWVVDPDQPSLTIWELMNGKYVEQAHVIGRDEHTVTAPYQVTLVPARLLD